MVLCGSPSNCTKPATIHYAEVREATPEWQTIRSEGVRKGSARYTLLMNRMAQRIKAAADLVARDTGHDLVVNKGDIVDERDRVLPASVHDREEAGAYRREPCREVHEGG